MITSPRNPKVAAAARLRKRTHRDRERRFLVEGVQGVREAFGSASGIAELFFSQAGRIEPLVARAEEEGIATEELGPEAMQRLSATVNPQGLIGVAPFLDIGLDRLPDDLRCAAVLCSGRDPGNAGSLLRSADASGADLVVFAEGSVDPYNPKAVRASAGSLFHVPFVRDAGIAETVAALKARGMSVYATAADGERDLYSLALERPTAFLFGNEAWGLAKSSAALADATVRIPLAGKAESLNMAAAAALCLFEVARGRRFGTLETMIAGAAHDIRSPLTAARNFAEVLLKTDASVSEDARRVMLEGIVRDSEQTDLILRQLIDAARISSGGLEISPGTVEIEAVVSEIAARCSFDPSHPPILWKGSGALVRADRSRLALALSAFVEAAVWWAREGVIEVSATREGGRIFVDVYRMGAEVPPDGVESLFLPRRPGSGAGSKIGMFVARGIARAHNGEAVASVLDGGLHMRLDLPG